MSEYIVSARKYRPGKFDEIVGQQNIVKTLKNAITNGQLAQAYLFSGPRGVGKTTCARIFAKTINCTSLTEETEACGSCDSCKAFESNTSFNVHELDAASNNSVEDIRNLIEQVRIPPQIGRYKVYIIDEVHMLSQQAFNAFLKTLEEPPKHAIFILATTEKHKIIPTILSRCQIFDFKRITVDSMVGHLKEIARKEQVVAEEDGLNIIAQKADGSLRDALSIFDKIVSFSDGNVSYQSVLENLNVLDYDYYFSLVDAFYKNDYAQAILIFDEILDKGFNESNFLNGLMKHFRDLLMLQNPETVKLLEVGEKIAKKYEVQAKSVTVNFLLKGIQVLNSFAVEHKTVLDKRLHVELALIEMSNITGDFSVKPVNEIEEKQANPVAEKPVAKEPVPSAYVAPKKPVAAKPLEKQTDTKELKTDEKIEKPVPPTSAEVKQANSKNPIDDIIPDVGRLLQNDTMASENEKEKSQNTKSDDLGNNKFSEEDLQNAWRGFASLYLKEDPRLSQLFRTFVPVIKDFPVLEIELLNENQETEIKSIYHELLDYLKKRLMNSKLKLNIVVNREKTVHSEVPYTDEDKYKQLKKENPKIDDLKDQLNLFVD